MEARIESDDCGRKIAVEPCTEPCAIERGMRVLGGKWTGSILWHLKDEPVRFNDLARMVGGASKKMIAERLTHLEAHGPRWAFRFPPDPGSRPPGCLAFPAGSWRTLRSNAPVPRACALGQKNPMW